MVIFPDVLFGIPVVGMALMSFSSCSISISFYNTSSNSIFDPICVVNIIDGLLVISFFFPTQKYSSVKWKDRGAVKVEQMAPQDGRPNIKLKCQAQRSCNTTHLGGYVVNYKLDQLSRCALADTSITSMKTMCVSYFYD